ncbi:MAG: putative Peptidoglycan glycosyltransferase [Candidatus Saccharibacteria bacterium]|nr:putative Peptidoglycan glycosyltransferase [Candidatus Saccharibacteria bacterium]
MQRQGKYTKKVSATERVKRRTKRRWLWFTGLTRKQKIVLIAGPILAFLILVPLITYLYYANDISDQERLMNRNNTGVALLDKNGEVFYSIGRAKPQQLLPLDQISDTTKQALLAAEDKDFYNHSGFSVLSIIKAMYANVAARDATGYGGSTLTQQLAKNTLLTANQTFLRKYQELAISVAIEQQYTKDEILNMYLNSVYFGENAFGIQDAAKTYFNKSPKDLTLAESSMLIGVLPAPSAYSPISGSMEYAKERQGTVLTRMVNNKFITSKEKEAAQSQELAYSTEASTANTVAPHFAEMVVKELNEKYGEERVARSGYQVKTTLDAAMQKQLSESIDANIRFIERNGGSNASAVAIDPTTGEVRALVGSADWTNEEWGKVNMVTTPRQPGSSFKPIYYAEALAQGVVTPATILADVPTDFNGYKPLNANRTFSGNVTARQALSRSLNIPAVKVMQQLSVEESMVAAKRMGIELDDKTDYGLSLALGSVEASLLQMTNAYAAFANQGNQFEPVSIVSIADKYNKTIFTSKVRSKEVQTPQGSYLISSMLSDQTARAPIFGSSLTLRGRTAAVKTGTTDNSRDAWTIGYTPQLAVGVWVGNNNNNTMLNGGSGMAGPIWVRAMQNLLADKPNAAFTAPSGVVQRSVCIGTGGLASNDGSGTYKEYFLGSALPKETCNTKSKAQEEAEKKKQEQDEKKRQEEAEKAAEEAEKAAEKAAEQAANEESAGTGTGTGADGTPTPTSPTSPTTPPSPGGTTSPRGSSLLPSDG